MIPKKFDCVKYQRDIRDKFINESGGDFSRLLLLLNKKKKESQLLRYFKEKQIEHINR